MIPLIVILLILKSNGIDMERVLKLVKKVGSTINLLKLNSDDNKFEKIDLPGTEELPFEIFSPKDQKRKVKIPGWILTLVGFIKSNPNSIKKLLNWIGDKSGDQSDQEYDKELVDSILDELKKLRKDWLFLLILKIIKLVTFGHF